MHRFKSPSTLTSWLPTHRRRSLRRIRPELLKLEDRVVPASTIGAGTGLVANYYSDANLTNLVSTRIDPGVNFTWGANSPAATVPADNFSVRWTGQIQAQVSETYTFSTVSSGGVRLWVNGQELIDHWSDHATATDSGTIVLQAGESYSIKLEYENTTGPATAQLFWSSPSTPNTAVPATQLYPSGGWLDADLGAAGGSVRSTGGTFTIQGNGNLGGTTDGGHFVYQALVGDATVTAQVTGGVGQSGLMIRDGLAANGVEATIFRAADGVHFEARTTAGAAATDTVTATTSNYLKLVRDGNLVSGYTSATGADNTWTLVGTATLSLSTTVEYGFAAAGGTATVSTPSVTPVVAIGANLMPMNDWSLDNAFVDIFKQARDLYSVSKSAAGPLVAATVDANGWATEDFIAFVQSGFVNTAHIYNGTYKLSFTGQATVDTWITPGGTVTNVQYNAGTNTTTADVTLNAKDSDGGWYFTLKFTNTHGTVRNVQLIRPGYDPANHPTFTQQFLATLDPFTTLRTMQFTATIDNAVVNWADRAHVTDATQSSARGVAWEYVAELANESHKDVWINIPVGATDDYVRQLAVLFKSMLAPDRVVYVEFSNEMWNSGYSETTVNKNAAVAEVAAGIASGHPSNLMLPGETAKNADGSWAYQWEWAFRRQARRTKEISDIFASVWGPGAINGQVRVVLATQLANPYIGKTQLSFLDQTYGSPGKYLYSVSGAPYFFIGAGDQQNNLTPDQIIAGMSASIDSNAGVIQQYSQLAKQYGLQLTAYEGGPDTFGPNNIAAKKAASLDPHMKDLTVKQLTQWFGAGGGLFAWFVAGPTNYDTQYGTWGMTNDINDLNSPKMQGIKQVEAGQPKATVGVPAVGTIAAINYVGATATTAPYPRYLHNGAALDYLVRSPAYGPYTLKINYAAVSAGGKLRVWVNGTVVQTIDLAVTGPHYDSMWAPNDFADSQAIAINLAAGVNDVRLEVVSEGYTINALNFTGASQPGQPAPPVVITPPPVVVTPPPVTVTPPPVTVTPPPATSGPTLPTRPFTPVPLPPPLKVDETPTFAAAARGSTTRVAGTSVALSALGTDDGGETSLTYTWATLGTPPAPVSFTANGTNAAKATTALFRKSGSYMLQLTIRDADGLTATSLVSVNVVPTLSAMTLSPTTNTVNAGSNLQLTAAAFDQFGLLLATNPAWSVTGTGAAGGITPTGLYTSSAAGGKVDTITATAGGISASATVTVLAAPAVAKAAAPSVSSGLSYVKGFSSIGLTTNGYAAVVDSRLRLTNNGFQRASTFFQAPVGISRFATSFNFQSNNASGEGIAFVLQGNNANALGTGGGGLGYGGIAKSIAVLFDTNGDAGVGKNMIGLTINGGTPIGASLNLTAAGIDLRSGHEMRTVITYDAGVLTVNIADVQTGKTAQLKATVDVAKIVGGTAAYTGFTAATNGLAATQEVLNWTFASVPVGQAMPQLALVQA
jgi:hypothetical protein